MPGVPSNRGCNTCCKLKKKCDQKQPKCTRCILRGIPCVGVGMQRFKFLHFTGSSFETANEDDLPLERVRRALPKPCYISLHPLASNLAHRLDALDTRFDLFCTYGGFFKGVPARLGTSPVIDSAINVFLSASEQLGTQSPSSKFYRHYGSAIQTLRKSLDGPDNVDPSHVLCSIYLIWMCQVWLGLSIPSHSYCIMSILSKNARIIDPHDGFQRSLLMAAGVTVMFERQSAFYTKGFRGPSSRRGILTSVFRLPELMKFDPSLHAEVRAEYDYISRDTAATLNMLRAAGDTEQSCFTKPNSSPGLGVENTRTWFMIRRFYCLELCLQRLLNGILRSYEPGDRSLEEDSSAITDIMESMVRAWPTGSTMGTEWIPFGLVTAWATSTSDVERANLDKVWSECCASAAQHSVEQASEKLTALYDRLRSDAVSHRAAFAVYQECLDPALLQLGFSSSHEPSSMYHADGLQLAGQKE